MSVNKVSSTKHYIFEILTVIIMFAGFFMPENNVLPHYGMQVLFIFIGLVVGWSVVGLIMPSILGLIALAFTDAFTIKSVWAAGFGSEIVILIILFCVFSKWLENVGFTDTLVNWFLSRKCFYGKPWLFITCFFLVVFALAFFASTFPAIFIGWACAYKICEVLGYEKRSPFCGFLVFNIAALGIMGSGCKPWSAWGLAALNAYNQAVPDGIISYGDYMLFYVVVYFTATALTILFGKFVMKIDVTPFVNGDYRQAARDYHFDRTQKFACVLMLGMIVGLFIPGYLPACALKTLLKNLGTIGIISVVLLIAGGINMANGKPFLDFKKVASHDAIPWDPIMLLSATVPLGSALKADEAGIMNLVAGFAMNHMEGLSPIIFYISIAVFLGLLTQIAHNLVLLAAFTPMFCTVGIALGMSPELITMIASIMLTAALGSPAGSTRSGMLFGNSEYITLGDCYKLGWFSLLAHVIACCAIGIPLGMLLF